MVRLGSTPRIVSLVLVLLLSTSAWAEVCKGSKVPKPDLATYDAQAVLAPDEQLAAIETHLPYGQSARPRFLPNREYVLCHDPVNRVALWAAYKLTADDMVSAQRLDAFRTDHRLSAIQFPSRYIGANHEVHG